MSETAAQHWTAELTAHPDAEGDRWAIIYDPTPGGRDNGDGTRSYSLRFPALLISEYVQDPEGAARKIAEKLNQAEPREPSCVVTDEVEIDEASTARDEPTVTVDIHGGGIAGVDESIAPLVKLLNGGGIATVASCSGHGQRPGNIALADGRELIIARNWNEARLIDGLFPGINGEPAKGVEGALEFIRQSDEDIRADERRAWRPGDVVHHKPSGEEWVILRIDLDSDSLIPAGWPKSRARVSDCVFVKAGDPNSYVGGEITRSLTNGGE